MNNFLCIDFNGKKITAEYIYTERQVNFSIKDDTGYLFRLVPAATMDLDLDISPLDKCLGVYIDWNLYKKVSAALINHDL